jgi:hypothetical protein
MGKAAKKKGGAGKAAKSRKPAARSSKKTAKPARKKPTRAKAKAKKTPRKPPAKKSEAAKKPSRTAKTPAAKPAPVAKTAAKKPAPAKPGGKVARPGKGAAKPGKGDSPSPPPRTRSRSRGRSRRVAAPRRGPDGELLAPGELLLPGGPKSEEEILYLLRGCVAGEVAAGDLGVEEILAKQASPGDPQTRRATLEEHVEILTDRFASGGIDPHLPQRAAPKQTFAAVVDRARQRRREIGAFLRGLDLAQTETSHMDSHGEASLQNLMEWAARLEKLIEAEEPEKGDYAQFHRGMDQLDHTTEALLVDVELTLRRLGSRGSRR